MALNYRPYEEQQLEALLKSGLVRNSPEQAYSIFQGLQGQAIDRRTQMQQQNQAMMNQAMQAMQGYATAEGADKQGLNALLESFQAANPQLEKPKFATGLEGLVQSLTPLTLGGGGGGAAGLGEDANAVAEQAANAAATGVPLHNARMMFMSALRASGDYNEQQLNEAYDLFGRTYELALGHPYGGSVPITMADRTPQSWTAAARPGYTPPAPAGLDALPQTGYVPQPIGPGTYGGNQHMADWLQQVYANQRG